MVLRKEEFWARKKGSELVADVRAKIKRYFDVCEQVGLIERWRSSYASYFQRDPRRSGGALGASTVELDLGSRKKPAVTIRIPETRSLMRQQLAFQTAEPVSFQCVSSTGEQRSVMSSEVGEKAVNYIYAEHIRKEMVDFTETALIYGSAATHLRWDTAGGDDVEEDITIIDPNTQQPMQAKQPGKSGVPYVDICDPTFWAYDPVIGLKAGWIAAFERTNLYVLAALYPELEDKILGLGIRDEYEKYRIQQWQDIYGADEGDCIAIHWYYLDRPEMQKGRYCLIVGDQVLNGQNQQGTHCPLPAGRSPVRPLITSKMTDCALSHADSWGVAAIEEALNRLRSSELTNYAYFGNQVRYREEGINIVPSEELSGGVREMRGPRGANPPMMLPIHPMPDQGAQNIREDLLEALPRISGFGDVSRGQIEKTTSGAHASVFEAITARNLSLIHSKVLMHEQELANDAIEMVGKYANTSFIAEVAGKDGAILAQAFKPEEFSTLRRVVAKAIPDAMRGSLARIQLVEVTKDIQDPRERAKAVQMVVRGDDEYGRNDQRALNLIAMENEWLISGEHAVEANITENHSAHLIDHQAAFDLLRTRPKPDKLAEPQLFAEYDSAIARFGQHIQEHCELAEQQDPVLALALGYPPPPILPGNAAFIFAQRTQEAQSMLAPPPDPNADPNAESEQQPV